jgi:hypothetical protein
VTDTNSNEQDAHWRTYIESDVIRFVDLPPGDHDVQIKEVKRGKVTGAGGKQSGKPMIYLVGKDKPIAGNAAICSVIEQLYGKAPARWKGKWISIFGDPTVKYGGIAVGGIRVRPAVPKASPK